MQKSIFNAVSNSLILIIRSVLLFLVRIVFVKTLGKTFLGVDSLFTNILLVLSIADSGISTAINFSLYKPLAEHDDQKVSSLMTFYKKMYKFLGIIVLIIGLLFIPFLKFIITENIEHIHLYYLVYLLTTVMSYFISYKDSLLNADQNLYKSSLIVGITYIVMYLLRILFLFLVPNFLIFALIQLIMMFIQRILVNKYITKTYKNINFNEKKEISRKEQQSIFRSVKSMFLNKFGYFLVTGTDNIIISAIPTLGLTTVAVYTNYYSIVSMVDSIINRGLSGITSSFGDLAVNESKEVQENVFDIISFLSFCIYGLFSIGFLFLISDFIKICFGKTYQLSSVLTLIICINFYIIGILRTLDIIKEATGNYIQDRYANLIQAIVNIILSIFLGRKIGLLGIVVATLISYITVPLWNKPYITYKYIFQKKPIKYLFQQLKYILSLLVIGIICYYIMPFINIDNVFLAFIIRTIVITFIYILCISFIYWRNNAYKYLLNIVKKIVKK